MNESKDQNFNNSVQSSSDLTDEQTTSSLHLHLLYDIIIQFFFTYSYFYLLCMWFTSVGMPTLKRNILNLYMELISNMREC